MHISLSLIASIVACVQLISATPTSINVRADNGACAKVSSASAALVKATPGATRVVAAELAYNCFKSVPLKIDPAVALTKALKTYAQLNSEIDYIRSPPSGYLYDAVDIPQLLENIQAKITSKDPYASEYDFQVDLQSTFVKGRDGHTKWVGELVSQFTWLRPLDFSLVSVSMDGKALPQVYRAQDILDIGITEIDVLNNTKASPIKTINGMDVELFLIAEGNQKACPDPDNAYNARMFGVQKYFESGGGNIGLWNEPAFYPGPTTTVEFQNGTKSTFNNLALIKANAVEGISSGEDMYKKYCSPTSDSDDLEKRDNDAPQSHEAAANLMPRRAGTESLYPTPDFVDISNIIAGYIDKDDDVAVLTVHSFSPAPGNYTAALLSFQNTAQEFFAECMKQNIQNLIIDLQGNPGGAIDLSLELSAQLFPTKPPNSKNNMRASLGMHGVMLAASNYAQNADDEDPEDNALADDQVVPFAYQEVMTPEVTNFNRLQDYYGPAHVGNGFFTNFFQTNYTNDRPSEFGLGGIVITGTNSRKNFKQPFKPENMIMVADGYCASACTIFQEHMKTQGVQIIALGGRAQTGPMQAVGGTKGSQVFETSNIKWMVHLFNDKSLNTELSSAKGTIWEDFNTLPGNRSAGNVGINGKNQFRIGDSTQTPLQYVYEAADCRIWYTPAMIADPTEIWDRVNTLAFKNRKNGVITSEYCVTDSTKHPTSISGGLKTGEIGPQNPPANAKPKVTGILFNGKDISGGLASGQIGNNTVNAPLANSGDAQPNTNIQPLSAEVVAATSMMVNVCKGYKGQEWFVQLMCGALMKSGGS